MATARSIRTFLAAATSVVLLSPWGGAKAGIVTPDPSISRSNAAVDQVQYGYGYGYGYRPYRYYGYRPYGYYPYRRFYNNHFGPGAAKERHRTRLDYCIKQPSKC